MTERHESPLDLNLLRVLHVLIEEVSVTRAARRLGMTQPGVSRSLARLRQAVDDELLVRVGRGLVPTRRALELAAPLGRSLAELEALVRAGGRFDHATTRRRFVVAAYDHAQLTLLGPLVRALAAEAPGVDLSIRAPSAEVERDLESGALDLLLAPRASSGTGIVWSSLLDDRYTCLVDRDHPARRLSLEAYASLEHVLVAPRERPGGVVDDVLAGRGMTRRVAVQIPTFLLLPHVLVGTARVATVPERVAGELARAHALRLVTPPLEIPGFTMCGAWHEVHRADPGHRWLRERLAAIARTLPRLRVR